MNLDKILKKYDYHLPPELIAQAPARPRDSARMLIYNRRSKQINFDHFYNLAKYLPKNSVLVFNQTKVWPARLEVIKPTGGKVELLYLGHDKTYIRALANKKLQLGSTVTQLSGRTVVSEMRVAKKLNQTYYLIPSYPISQIPTFLKKYGVTPLPPYIKHSPLTEKQKREQYQTVFAKTGLSVAAPTASLHFTKKLMNNLRRQGIDIKFVRLDVGLGTFAPLKPENISTKKLHQEFYNIDKHTADFFNRAKQQGRPIIAVGTTVVRTLESAFAQHQAAGQWPALQGNTDLFIQENYKFKFVDGLITNFHVPKSSLLMLVSAFAGRKVIHGLYQQAIKESFRFFSFGDGMLIT